MSIRRGVPRFGTDCKQHRSLGPRPLLTGYIDGKNEEHSFDVQVDTAAEARAAVQRYKNAGFDQIKIRDHVKSDILKLSNILQPGSWRSA